MIHGIGHQYRHRRVTKAAWEQALADGLYDSHLPGLRDGDVDVVYYGNCFRTAGAKGAEGIDEYDDIPPVGPGNVAEVFEADLVAAIAAGLEVPEDTKVYLPGPAQRLARWVQGGRFVPGAAPKVIFWLVKQVGRYFADEAVRECVQERVERSVTDDTMVLVGHSLGSVVAYEALCRHPEWKIDTLLTLGSPLGFREVGARLRPPVVNYHGHRPGVRKWVNVAAAEDAVAIVKELGPIFGDVDDRPVHNGRRHAHDVARYLTSPEACNAIADAVR
jgi:hypothetical protein